MLIDMWTEDKNHAILLITPKGQSDRIVRLIRVALSKERSIARRRSSRVNYGFKQSTPFPFTENGVLGEAVTIRWRITGLQKVKNMEDDLFGKEMTRGY